MACHFLLQCMQVKSESEVARSYGTFSDPMVCSLPGSSGPMGLLATPWSAASQAPPSMGFSRQEDWSGLPLRRLKG